MAQAGDFTQGNEFSSMSLLGDQGPSQMSQMSQGGNDNQSQGLSSKTSKKYPCSRCDSAYAHESGLRNHMKKKHGNAEDNEDHGRFLPARTSTKVPEPRDYEKSKNKKFSESDYVEDDGLLDADDTFEGGETQQTAENMLRVLDEADNKLVEEDAEEEDEFGDPNESINRDRDEEIKRLSEELKYSNDLCSNKDARNAELSADLVEAQNLITSKEIEREKLAENVSKFP